SEIVHRLFSQLAAERVMGEALDLLAKTGPVEGFDRVHEPRMEMPSPLLEQSLIGDLMRQRVLEGVLEVREEPRFVQELRPLQPGERLTSTLLWVLGDRLQQCERHGLAHHSRCLQQALVAGSEAVDARSQNRLSRGRKLKVLDWRREPIGPAVPRERPRLDQRPHTLFEEEGIALRA